MFSFFRKKDKSKVVVKRPDHNISRKNIDPDALKVLYRLSDAGFDAYLVGGGVRDLLLERTPKDFDVGTNARPEEIKHLFRNCMLIGRRFRLAHILFAHRKIIETSTFRAKPVAVNADPNDKIQHDDNVFGTPEQDAKRRDFTVNGIFYDIKTFSVIDYVGGLKDLKAKIIRTIGDPGERFQEDPVRMMRAVKFASRLDFKMEPATKAAILKYHNDILKASVPRVCEEIFRLFSYSSGEKAFRLMWELKMLKDLLPDIDVHISQTGCNVAPLWQYLRSLDNLPGDFEPTNAVRLATLLYTHYRQMLDNLGAEKNGRLNGPLCMRAANEALRGASLSLKPPRGVVQSVKYIWFDLRRFADSTSLPRAQRFLRSPHFLESLVFATVVAGVSPEKLPRLQEWIDAWKALPLPDELEEPTKRPHPRRRGGRRRHRLFRRPDAPSGK